MTEKLPSDTTTDNGIAYVAIASYKKEETSPVVVLCDYEKKRGSSESNFTQVSFTILTKLKWNDKTPRQSYEYDSTFTYHTLYQDQKMHMILAKTSSVTTSEAYRFLQFIATEYSEKNSSESFKLKPIVTSFPDSIKLFQPLKDQISKVQRTAVENIELILERGEKLSLLVEKSDSLSAKSIEFHQTSTALKAKIRRRQIIFMISIGVTCVLLLYGLAATACGLDFSQC